MNVTLKWSKFKVIAKARSLRPEDGQKLDMEKIKQAARDVINKYQALSEETKEELKVTFPHTAKIISSELFYKIYNLWWCLECWGMSV